MKGKLTVISRSSAMLIIASLIVLDVALCSFWFYNQPGLRSGKRPRQVCAEYLAHKMSLARQELSEFISDLGSEER